MKKAQETKKKPAQKAKAKKPAKKEQGKPGFEIPRTLKAARALGLTEVTLGSSVREALLEATPIAPMAITNRVPVGHLWRLGAVHGDKVYACYRTRENTCHWVEVPISNIPDWDPEPTNG